MDVIAVGDVVLIRNTLDDAKTLLQTLCKTIRGGFHRGAVNGVADVFGSLPLLTFVVELLHYGKCELLTFRRRVSLADHADAHFAKSRITKRNRRIAVKEQLVDGLAFLETSQRAVLPQDRSHVRLGSQQTLVSAPQRSVAQLQTLFQDRPEAIHIALGRAGHVNQVDGHNALVEPAVILSRTVRISLAVLHCREGTAAHARVHIALLERAHDFGGNIVRHHTLGCALCSKLREMPVSRIFGYIVLVQHIDQLRERRGDPHALFVLDALHPLQQNFLDEHGQVVSRLTFRHLVQVHEHGHERRLSVTGHQGDQLILDGLDPALDFLSQAALHDFGDDLLIHILAQILTLFDDRLEDLLAAHIYERRQVR